MRKLLIVGATSAIAQELTRLYAEDGDMLFLTARDQEKLQAIAEDLRVRGARQVKTFSLDINDLEQHPVLFDKANEEMAGVDTVVIAHGTLPDQKACEKSVERTLQEIKTNALSVISLLTLVSNKFEKNRKGSIIVISSVAGDRGRQSNYVYGASKAMVTTFLSGLRNRLHAAGVHVLTVKPGFVSTPMTAHFKKGVLWVSPTPVARRIYNSAKKNKEILYVPWFWWWIMLLIRNIPEKIFKKMRL